LKPFVLLDKGVIFIGKTATVPRQVVIVICDSLIISGEIVELRFANESAVVAGIGVKTNGILVHALRE